MSNNPRYLHLVITALVSAVPLRPSVAADIPSPTFTNSLGMPFAKVSGTQVLFCIWPTRAQDYAQWLKEAGKSADAPSFTQRPTHPAVNVSWHEAKTFCQWLTDKERKAGRITQGQSYRLPTDAEWSVAVGLNEPAEGTPAEKDGKIKDVFLWGKEWPPPKDAGNYGARLQVDSYPETSPVGSFKANQFGLYDMGATWTNGAKTGITRSRESERCGARAGPRIAAAVYCPLAVVLRNPNPI